MVGLIAICVILGCISISCFIYSMFAFHGKGPILTNEYILATSEEKRKLVRQNPYKKKKDYRFAAQIFLCISIIFFIEFINIFLQIFHIQANTIFTGIVVFLSVALIVYVIVTAIRDGEFS